MYIIEVIPLVPLPPQVPQLLSYFFNSPLSRGALVEIPIHNRKVSALVIDSYSLEEQKISLKKSGFQLKKISTVISELPKLTEVQFRLALWLSKTYYSPLGLSFKTILPSFFNHPKYPFTYPEVISKKRDIRNKPTLLLTGSKKIIDAIKPEIKKVISRGEQVLLIVPEISIAKYFYDVLAGYHETSFISGKLTLRQLYKEWQRILSGDAEIIIGTRQALFAPFSKLGLIIMEDPANMAYKSDMTPKYNTPDLVIETAKVYESDLILISRIPDVNGYFILKNDGYELKEVGNFPKVNVKLENILQEIKSGNFSLFSRELKSNILKYAKEGKKILIFSSRKGYSSALICQNCGFCFKCPQCSVPLKIYTSPEQVLMCHRCSLTQKMPQECSNCHSYKLKSAGFAGTEKLKEELERTLAGTVKKEDIFSFDLNSFKNLKTELELVKKMEERESLICVATQALFSHRFSLKFDLIAVPNLDGLTPFPDFRTEEELFLQFEKLLDFEPEQIILQTFNPENKVSRFLLERNYKEFYEQELQSRKLFQYPPFTRLIKLSFSSPDKNKAGYESRILNEKLKMAILQRKLGDSIKIIGPSPAFISKERNSYIYNLVLKVTPEFKIDEILKFVPSNWSVNIDPRSIL